MGKTGHRGTGNVSNSLLKFYEKKKTSLLASLASENVLPLSLLCIYMPFLRGSILRSRCIVAEDTYVPLWRTKRTRRAEGRGDSVKEGLAPDGQMKKKSWSGPAFGE